MKHNNKHNSKHNKHKTKHRQSTWLSPDEYKAKMKAERDAIAHDLADPSQLPTRSSGNQFRQAINRYLTDDQIKDFWPVWDACDRHWDLFHSKFPPGHPIHKTLVRQRDDITDTLLNDFGYDYLGYQRIVFPSEKDFVEMKLPKDWDK